MTTATLTKPIVSHLSRKPSRDATARIVLDIPGVGRGLIALTETRADGSIAVKLELPAGVTWVRGEVEKNRLCDVTRAEMGEG